ncbi:hypothetical protein PROVALCAL_00984 [Providencia alcalifaciens DSM 30120]|uniref:Uncharacterized protein n=1 Tax=Providencia alcalifaciens DSM 30120 TaxID=520999 RepID=B6XCC1_9GAMM|nr:hypothetical protein PROVALCAL_00984 [Providencia alcalifaciens DSM 30120]
MGGYCILLGWLSNRHLIISKTSLFDIKPKAPQTKKMTSEA